MAKAAMLIVVVLASMLVWVSAALVRVENQRYAMYVGVCEPDFANPLPFWNCLRTVQTRTAWWWHLYYALSSKDY